MESHVYSPDTPSIIEESSPILTLAIALLACSTLLLQLAMSCWRTDVERIPESVLITGAAGGIGSAVARTFGSDGCKLVLWDTNMPALLALREKIITQIASNDGKERVLCDAVDVADADAVNAALKRAVSFCGGKLDCVVSNAGITSDLDIEALSAAQVARTFGVNVFASFNLLRGVLPSWRTQVSAGGDGGCFVLVSSVMGTVGSAQLGAYCSSKFALMGLGECLRLELSRDGLARQIPVILMCPYAVRTGMFDGIFEDARDRNYIRSVVFPQLSIQVVADALRKAVLARRSAVIFLPWHAYPALLLVNSLPLWLSDVIKGWLGGWWGMSKWRGNTSNTTPVAAKQ